MTSYRLSELAEFMEAKTQLNQNPLISDILTDSRTYRGGKGFMFFALIGLFNDGHRYIERLYERGLRSFVVSREIDQKRFPEAEFLVVEDTLLALQKLAKAHRKQFDYPVWGITGSNGKTVVKEWLFQLLGSDRRIVRSPRSYNSQVGVPLSLWLMSQHHDMALIECGISRKGEMERLEEIVKPDIGIFTSLGPPHQENFSDYREKAEEKLKLFKNCSKLFYCKDHSIIDEVVTANYSGEIRTWSENKAADLVVVEKTTTTEGLRLKGRYKGKDVGISIPFNDKASYENACLCWLILLHEGLPEEEIERRMADLQPVAMRMQKLQGINDCVLINDSYNSDLASLDIALDFQSIQSKGLEKAVILSDILQTGESDRNLYRKVADLLVQKGIQNLIGIGEKISEQREAFNHLTSEFHPSTEEFLKGVQKLPFRKTSILIKGARKFRFERIVERLELKTHETVLEVDLNAMISNYNYVRSKLQPNTKIMAMVKAFSYGSGTFEIAAALEHLGVDYLAVAYVDEGISLREAGIKTPILVLNPETSAYEAMIRYELEPQIYSFYTLHHFRESLRFHSDVTPYPIHIKINTGMNRLGFEVNDAGHLAEELISLGDVLEIKTVFSHLAGSDSSDFDKLTATQINNFKEVIDTLSAKGLKKFDRHILNSGGILRHEEAQMEMVRLGLALYGVSSNPEFRANLHPIARLFTVISQVRNVPKGKGVGYSPEEVLKKDTKVGVIAMGYADGLPRILGNGGGWISVNGKRAPFIGDICMDMAMVDLTGIECQEGDRVEIFGNDISIYEMAKWQKTIPYEVLTNIKQRVKRVFFKE